MGLMGRDHCVFTEVYRTGLILVHHFALALPSLGSVGATGLLGSLLSAKVVDQFDPCRYSAGVFAVLVAALGAI